jgi:hypothetical protein
MQHLAAASRELFKRTPDETYPSVAALSNHCETQRANSAVHWLSPERLHAQAIDTRALVLAEGEDLSLPMNDWSFGQLCRLANVEKRTINRLTADTASRVFSETLPRGNKPLQVYTVDGQVKSIHGGSYTRLHDAEVLDTVLEAADGFDAPPKGFNGATGLYGGEQDMFCFLIDPTGWIEIDNETFAPGFFVWNSEVGRRTVGIQTFWFQQICQNHIVWDAVEVFDIKRKHTANVHRGLDDIRDAIHRLVAKRDARRDQFATVIKRAMGERFADPDEAYKAVMTTGVGQRLAKQAVELAGKQGRLTIFSMVDALTRLSGKIANAGDRNEVDQQVGQLLSLAI